MRSLAFCAPPLLFVAGAIAQAPTTMVEQSLFNGRDLGGWHGQRQFDPVKLAALPENERTKILAEDAASKSVSATAESSG